MQSRLEGPKVGLGILTVRKNKPTSIQRLNVDSQSEKKIKRYKHKIQML